MAVEVFNRHECKYIIHKEMLKDIENRLLEHMVLDEYNKSHEFYTISNIYFDTKDNEIIRNSISKPSYKEKLRLRAYGVPWEDQLVFLEIKKKVLGFVNKRRTNIELREAYDFVNTGRTSEIKAYMNKQVLHEIEYILQKQKLEPRIYLAYDRKAYFGKWDKSLRVTFDTNIRTRREDLRLESGDHGEALLDSDKILMEVKVEKSIPLWMAQLLSEYKVYKTSFSKYGKEYEKTMLKDRNMKGAPNICLKDYTIAYSPQVQAAQQCL